MALWWIGNAVLLLVVIPAVVVVAQRVLRPALEIRRYADDAAEHGALLPSHLDPLEDLDRTRELAGHVATGLERYRRALDELL